MKDGGVRIELPERLPGKYAYVVKVEGVVKPPSIGVAKP
jgi:hypothetical protein